MAAFEGLDRGIPEARPFQRFLQRFSVPAVAIAMALAGPHVLPVHAETPASGDPTTAAERRVSQCSLPPGLTRLAVPLDATRSALAANRGLRVVALGSSSTAGAGASSPRMCYPAQLEGELNRRLSLGARAEVVNLGVGGEMAADMVARIDKQVVVSRPHLVIWQTGVNDAIAGVPLDDFRMQLAQGIDAIRAAGADVILLDLQYYPRSERVRGYRDYLSTIWQVGREMGVPVLKRHTYMKHLLDSRKYTAAQILAPDLFHLNDLSYHCLGHMVADAIEDGVKHSNAETPPMRNALAPR